MGRFDVYAKPGKGAIGYVLDVQANLLQELGTRVVVPLLPAKTAPKPARGLNPAFEIDGQDHLMLTQFIAAIPARELRKSVLSLNDRSDDIMRALDVLLTGSLKKSISDKNSAASSDCFADLIVSGQSDLPTQETTDLNHQVL